MKLFRKLLSLTLALLLVSGIVLPTGMTALAVDYIPRPPQDEAKVKAISVDALPTTTEYTAGQALSLDGLVVELQYDKGGTKLFTPDKFAGNGITVTPAEGTILTVEGKNTITVAHGELTDTFEINVAAESSDVVVSSITVNTQPSTTEFYLGQKLNLDGLTVKLHYSDGSSNIVSAADLADKDITVTPAEYTILTTEGKNTVTLAYGELTASFDITVLPVSVSAIVINTQPTRTEYEPGEKLDLDGLTVKIEYSDGSSNLVKAADFADKDITVIPAEGTVLNTEGKNTITLAYEKLTASFDVTVAPAQPDDSDEREIDRIFGSDRYETALAISSEGWESTNAVIIASGSDFADALAGATLSKVLDAPILLVSHGDNSHIFAEIKRLGAKNAYILGGENAVSAAVENDLLGMELNVERLNGTDRYATAAAIAAKLNEYATKADKAFVVSGESFADALSAGYAAAMTGSPILYTNADKLNDTTAAYIAENGIGEVVIIGGSDAVSDQTAEQLSKLVEVNRIGGEDRYQTSLAVAQFHFDHTGRNEMAIATGKNFPDALTGGAYAIKLGVPVLLVGDEVNSELLKYMDDCSTTRVILFGGENALSADIAESLK